MIVQAFTSRRPISLWAYTADCDATIAPLRAAGVTIADEPTDRPSGERLARASSTPAATRSPARPSAG